MTMFAPQLRMAAPEEKKDVFAPVADLMVGVVFIFIVMVLALSLLMMDDIEHAVPKTVYDQAKSELDDTKDRLQRTETDRDAAREMARMEGERADREKDRADSEEASRRRLAEFVRYMRDTGVVPVLGRLAEADKRRTEILEKLKERLLVSDIRVEIDAENGTLRLPSTKLFESAKADPTPQGTEVIRSLGVAIADIVPCYLASTKRPASCPEIEGAGVLSAIYIEGHTDAAPFRNIVDRFRNNWDLSAARAIEAFRIVSDSDSQVAGLRNAEGKALVGVSGYADTRPALEGMPGEQRLQDGIKETDRRIEVRLIMAVDQQEVLSTLREINRRLEGLDVDLR
jgi:flagellar motor protein MotB